MKIVQDTNTFSLYLNDIELITHTPESPAFFVGCGDPEIEMHRGNFKIKDYVVERIPLKFCEITEDGDVYRVNLRSEENGQTCLELKIFVESNRLNIKFKNSKDPCNRYWMRINADPSEKVYGCGEQLSYFNLRGKNFPIWTSEPGVGRNINTYTTWKSEVDDKAGGDYYTTNFPLPTFTSSKKYYCHVESTAYMDFNFRNDDFHEIQVWAVPEKIVFQTAKSWTAVLENLTNFVGRQPELPDWVHDGFILGVQGGTEVVEETLNRMLDADVPVCALWCQDWQGVRHTSFGKRLMWNWKWNEDVYPGLDKRIYELKEKGVRFMSYINPYLAVECDLFKEAEASGYLATKIGSDEVYLVDFGEFDCGIVDFTNGDAFEWFKKIIKENLIDFGFDGWMADFGEYLPTDCELSNGVSAEVMHNAWPAIWAKVNYEAVKESGKLGEVVYFMRAGFTGSQKYCTLVWAGDQCVNWELDDGLASVIPAALSLGMSGYGLHHSDIGGYTSLHGNIRTKELFMRWAELAAFTPVMRSHEGNRPDENFQIYKDNEAMEHLAAMTRIHVKMKPYIKKLVKDNSERGIPVQRPIFMNYEADEVSYGIKYQYLFGQDILVAPVYEEGKDIWDVYLPEDKWVHLWTGKEFAKGSVKVEAPLGMPPVFYRQRSEYADLFEELKKLRWIKL